MSRQKILFLGLLTLLLMGAGGGILTYFLESRDFNTVFSTNHLLRQALYGALYGIIAGIVAWQIVSLSYLDETRRFFTRLLSGRGLTWLDVVFISICAGVGEEILFRVFLQAYLGIWLTSVLFVAIHGYLNPLNRPLFVYGLFMVLTIAGMGFMMERLGIYSAMISHTVIDILLLGKLVRPTSFV